MDTDLVLCVFGVWFQKEKAKMNHPSEIRFAPHCHEFHGVNEGANSTIETYEPRRREGR